MRSCYSNLAENWSVKGGFLQSIYYGYGSYVFGKPFSRIIETWGCKKISRIVEEARSLYEKHKGKIGRVKTLKELSALCSEITDFEILDNEYMIISEEETEIIKKYIENNVSDFSLIDENNTQLSYVIINRGLK